MKEQPDVPISEECAMIARLTDIGLELTKRLVIKTAELEKCNAFIARARQESTLIEAGGEFKVLLPFWFMKDE